MSQSFSDGESALLMFDEERPCWSKAMFSFCGLDTGVIDALLKDGLLEKEEDIYSLTRAGAARFRVCAEECFLPVRPANPDMRADKRREAQRSLLQMLIDKRHTQRWGLKEYCKPFRFEVPDLGGDELFTVSGQNLTWRWPESAVFANMARDFPAVGLAARGKPAPTPDSLSAWKAENLSCARTMEADLLYKSRYDFQAYAAFPKLPCDPCGLLNADRFLCFLAPPPCPENRDKLLTTLGEFHMFLTMLRRMYMPGYVDLDSLEQDGINWLVYVYEREADALGCLGLLSPFGQSLSGPAAPLEVWSLSAEALARPREAAESIHDLLPYTAHPIVRVDI